MAILAFEGEKHVEEYVYDFSVSGGAASAITLSDVSGKEPIPVGAIITDIHMYVETAMTSGGSATIAVGNGDDADGYLAATAFDTWSANDVVRVGEYAGALVWDDTNDHKLDVYVADANDGAFKLTIATAALTAGKLRFYVEYIMTRTN
jgi:hypothetical protein